MRTFLSTSSCSKRDDLKGACLFDTGANASIENDITAFVSYLEKSDVTIGMAKTKSLLRNCGIGIRERRFRASDGGVYVVRERAFYCPDAAYPISSGGEWENQGAAIVLNPGKHFTHTASGVKLPSDGRHAIIVDKDSRMLVLQQVPGVPKLHWLIPIQPTTVAQLENNTFLDRNRRFAANMLETLNAAADGPTVSDYAEKVQVLQQQLEEAHLLHSQLYGTSDQDNKLLIASAYESIASIDPSRRIPTGTYADPNNIVNHDPVTRVLCTRCCHSDCSGANVCT